MKKNFTISIDPEIMEELKRIAAKEERTLSSQLRFFIRKSIKAYNKGAAEGKPAGAISGDEFSGKRVDQDVIIELFERPKEEKRSIIQYLKKNGFIQEEVRGVGTCLIVPKDSDIKRLIKGFEPIEDL